MIKIWNRDDDIEYEAGVPKSQLEKYHRVYLQATRAEPFGECFPKTTIEFQSKNSIPDYFEANHTLFMASNRLRLLFRELRVQAEYFEVEVFHNGKKFGDNSYFFCNILDKVDCFDFVNGEYTFHKTPGFEQRVDSIKKLAIDENKIQSRTLFRIANGGEYIICAMEELVERVSEMQITGVSFESPENLFPLRQ